MSPAGRIDASGHYSPAHEDYGGYVVSVMPVNGIQIQRRHSGLYSGQWKVKLKLKKDQILVMKCTNTHEVEIITDGVRETLALFARPNFTNTNQRSGRELT